MRFMAGVLLFVTLTTVFGFLMWPWSFAETFVWGVLIGAILAVMGMWVLDWRHDE